MQVHRFKDPENGGRDTLRYLSRNANDHGEKYGYDIFDEVMRQQVKAGTFILDGEIVAWNKTK